MGLEPVPRGIDPCAITYDVVNAFAQSMADNFDQALRLMEVALTDCPAELWETDLWPDEAPTGPSPTGGLHGSAPWFLAYQRVTDSRLRPHRRVRAVGTATTL
jgi:hypothetical protein